MNPSFLSMKKTRATHVYNERKGQRVDCLKLDSPPPSYTHEVEWLLEQQIDVDTKKDIGKGVSSQ